MLWKNTANVISYRIRYIFDHNEKQYLINVFCDDDYEYIANARLIRSLNNKNSILYRTLLSAIEKFENDGKEYIVPKRVSRKIFISVGIRKYNQLKIRYKIPKKNPLSLYFMLLHWHLINIFI